MARIIWLFFIVKDWLSKLSQIIYSRESQYQFNITGAGKYINFDTHYATGVQYGENRKNNSHCRR